jgi:hypothetical protein
VGAFWACEALTSNQAQDQVQVLLCQGVFARTLGPVGEREAVHALMDILEGLKR